MRRSDGTSFTSGDLVVGRHVVAVYNGANFRTNIAPPTDAAITLSDIPNLPASRTTSGTFDVDRIPNLPASKIPDLPASKITSGTLHALRVATLLTQAGYDGITPDETKIYFISG